MSDPIDTKLDLVFGALSDPTRRSILEKLREEEYTVLELAENYDMTFQAVSKHLKSLEKAKLISRKKQGRSYRFQNNTQPIVQAIRWISESYQFWNASFDSLEEFLDESESKS